MPAYDPDRAASVFAQAARIALQSPPAWDGDRISIPTFTPEGAFLGRVLPGRGFLLGHDLKAFGIHRPIPGVFERSQVWRMKEQWDRWLPTLEPEWCTAYRHRGVTRLLLDSDRAAIELLSVSPAVLAAKSLAAAITTYDGIINARNDRANDAAIAKTSITTVAQSFSSLFRAGGLPIAGTYTNIPGGAVHTRTSTGAWHGLTNPASTDTKYLLAVGINSSSAIDWAILVDLLVAAGNISASITTSQTINSVAQTRQYGSTLGAGVMAAFDITTALGTGTGTFSLTSYTDQGGTTAQVSQTATSAASAIVMRLVPTGAATHVAVPWIALADGDYGVRSVETFAFSAAHSAGVIALNLAFPLAYVPGIAANIYVERSLTAALDALTVLDKDASDIIGCLTWYVQTNSTSSGTFRAFARSVSG